MIIRDPVHGDIELTQEEAQVLDTATMQRLRAIKQLGTAYLVYPGCTHTRFDHSLGTLAAAARILESLRKRGERVEPDDARLIRLAALVHDVTHIPFGHTFEDERKVFPRHDSPPRVRRFLSETELGELLEKLDVREQVIALLTRPTDWRGQVVSGTLDADLLDYLRRDSYFAGLRQDYDDRIYSYFCIEGDQLACDLTKKGMERHDARSEIVHLLRMRYFLTERVYFHHAKVISGAMVSKALELATAQGVTEEDLYDLGDESLFGFLSDQGEACAKLVQGVRRRKLYKRAFAASYAHVTPHEQERLVRTYHQSAEHRRGLEAAIAAETGIAADEVIVYCPPKTVLKEAAVLARLPEGTQRLSEVSDRHLELDAIGELYARIWRFWVFVPAQHAAAAGEAAERLLGIKNELTARA